MKDPFQRRYTPSLGTNGGTQYVLRVDCNRAREESDVFKVHVLALSSDVQAIKSVVETLVDLPTMITSLRDHLVEVDRKLKIVETVPESLGNLSNKIMEMDVSVKGIKKENSHIKKDIEVLEEEVKEDTGSFHIVAKDQAVIHRRVSDMQDLAKRKTNWIMTGLLTLVGGIVTLLVKWLLEKR
jgi:hypothetical protein